MKNLNELFDKFWEYIQNTQYITLCTHVQPDGDTLGSAVALKEIILLNTNVKEVRISGGDYPRNLSYLSEGIELVEQSFFEKSLKIVIDTSTPHRIFDTRVKTHESLKLDHHPHESEWKFEIGGDHWPATGQLLTLLVLHLNLKLNKKALDGIATAIITDTEFFKERNISSETFQCMAYLMDKGLNIGELYKSMALNSDESKQILNGISGMQTINNLSYKIIESMVSNDIVRPLVAKFMELCPTEIGVVFCNTPQGYRVEFRSKSIFDVSEVAKRFGGGGHYNSSGCISIDQANNQKIIDYLSTIKI